MSEQLNMKITDAMKEAGRKALFEELGFQLSPDHISLEQLAEAVFSAMLAVAPAELFCGAVQKSGSPD